MEGDGGKDAKAKETVKVVVRCRPFSKKEMNEDRKSIMLLDTQAAVVGIKCPENNQVKSFTFDSVYDEHTTQRQFYDESGFPLVESIFEGYNGTIFAYGQTGCGKTHTMQGCDSPPELRGVIPHSFDHIFDNIGADQSKEYMVRASYLEIYNEEIRDLLSDDQKKKLDLKEGADGTVYVKDLTDVVVSNVDAINRVMNKGFKNRTVGATLMNEGSSRSHSIFTVVVEVSEKVGDQERFKAGKLNLVDLAGSERQSKTGATGSRLKEGCKINLSLSALGNVISALVDGKGKHIPYRDSKLTRLLQDSLGGNTKTLMVAAISPADYNYDETLSTLRYANRAKNIKNKPMVNEDPKDAKLREYKEEIERLRKMLESQSQSRGSGRDNPSGTSTPSRPLSPTGSGGGGEGRPASGEAEDRQLRQQEREQEREEVLRHQREAAEMMTRAQRMMEEAQALRERQAQQQQPEQGGSRNEEGRDSSSANSTRSSNYSRGSSASSATHNGHDDSEEQGAPLSSQSPRTAVNDTFEEEHARRQARAQAETEAKAKAEAEAKAQAETQARALREAARVDAEAKAMMARAQQLMKEAELAAQRPPEVRVVEQVVVKEVVSDAHERQRAELQLRNEAMLDQQDRMGKELERAQQAMASHLREKEELSQKLKKIESQILGGGALSSTRNKHKGPCGPDGTPLEDSEITLLKQQVEYRRTQIKLKEKAKKEARFEAARRALTLEKQMVEEELKSAQESAQTQLAAAKKKEAKFRSKLEAARQEVVDLTNEFEHEREHLLDTIREQTRESKLLEQLVELFLPQNELVKVWERAVWLDDKAEWQLPKIKPRSDFQKIKLPTLGLGNGGLASGTNSAVESGGAEVLSDDDSCSVGSASVRSIGSSASNGVRRGRPPKASASSSSRSSSSPSGSVLVVDTSSKATSTHYSRMDEQQVKWSDPTQLTHRVLSPTAGSSGVGGGSRVPSATASHHRHRDKEKEEPPQVPQLDTSPGSSSREARSSSKKHNGESSTNSTKADGGGRRRSRDGKSDKHHRTLLDSSYDHPNHHHGAGGYEDDLLAPLPSDGYQPRDRLQSRQGSRQGTRSSTGQRTLNGVEAPPPILPSGSGFHAEKPPIASRGAHSQHGSQRPPQGFRDENTDEVDELLAMGERSPEATPTKKKSKHKKKKDRHRDRSVDPSASTAANEDAFDPLEQDETDLLNDLGSGFFLPRTRSGRAPT